MSMSMSMLLEELITEMLSRLPAKSLLRFQCVSKTWLALIKDPNFINMHLQNNRERTLIVQTLQTSQTWKNRIVLDLNYYLVNVSSENEDQPVKVFPSFFDHEIFSFPIIVDCCNGLVCVSTFYGEAVIWNPSIRKYKKLPLDPTVYDPRLLSNFPFPNDNFAFGYDPINNDYKFLRVVEHFESYRSVADPDGFAGAFEVKVCSLKAQSWRTVEAQWPYKESRIWSEPVYLNGALRWLIKTATRGMRLLAFHLYTEKFQEQTLTGLPVEPHTLEVLGGSLLCVSAYRREAQAIDFWMMKETSWSQLCTVPLPGIQCRRLVRAVFSTDGQKMLLIMQMDFEKNLFSYDIKKKTLSNFLTHIPEKIWTQISQESLLLLDGDSRDTSVD